tara:strand:- start:86 stop:727 length:642 start_codon:yes stop_codon:yes gene_type:complete
MKEREVNLNIFAESVRSMRTVHLAKEELELSITSVEEMFRLLHNLDVKISSVMSVQLDDLHNAATEHANILMDLEEFVEFHIGKRIVELLSYIISENITEPVVFNYLFFSAAAMKQELDSSIIKSEQGSSALIEQLNMGVLVDCHAPHDTVVLELKKLKHTLDKTKERTDQFIDYQELFEVGVAFPFENYHQSKETYNKRESLWSLNDAFGKG